MIDRGGFDAPVVGLKAMEGVPDAEVLETDCYDAGLGNRGPGLGDLRRRNGHRGSSGCYFLPGACFRGLVLPWGVASFSRQISGGCVRNEMEGTF